MPLTTNPERAGKNSLHYWFQTKPKEPANESASSSYFASFSGSSSDSEGSEQHDASEASSLGSEGSMRQQADGEPPAAAIMTDADELMAGCGY